MDLEVTEIQTSIIVVFLVTLITSLIPPTVKSLWSRRRDNNVFNVSDNNGTKTCMRHRKECTSPESHLLQIVNFLCGGLLFGLLVLRLMPLTYRQFDSIYNINNNLNNNTVKSPVVTEDNLILLNEYNEYSTSTQKKTLPYVQLMISGFFFVIYFIEQLIQAFTGWDGWHAKSSFVHLPAINSTNTSAEKHKTDNNCQTSEHSVKKECSEPSLVACYRKDIDSEITESKENSNTISLPSGAQHKPDCPLASSDGNNTINRKLRIPCRPSHPTSIIIVLPKETNDVSTTWLQLKVGFGIISSVSTHQLTNGVTIALMDGQWCWCAIAVILCHTILTSILMTTKLMNHSSDTYIMFLCQLIFASVMPFGIIITSFIKISSFSQLILLGVSSGASLHLIFMTLLQSERCTRLAGLVQYMAMYTGFTLVLCFALLIANN